MRSEWKKYALEDVCEKIYSGGTPSTKHPEYWDGNIKWLSSGETSQRFVYDTERKITQLGVDNSSTKKATKGCTVIATAGQGHTRGQASFLMTDTYMNQSVIACKANEKIIDPLFLYYNLDNRYEEFRLLSDGTSTRGGLSGWIVKRIEIQIPCIAEQCTIARILKSLDEKIEVNNKINKNLLQQMESLYKAWFIDFDPFDGNRPVDWQKSDIYSIANIIYGAPFASKLFNTNGEGIPIIRIRDLKEQAFVTYTTENHPKGHLIQPGDIVVGMDGEFRPYIWGNTEAWLNQRVCIFENKRPKGKAFVLFTINPLLYQIEQTQVATTVIHIGKKDYDAFEFYLPDNNTLNQYDEITSPMIDRIVVNSLENKRLATIRDKLLPRLMSGEMDVSKLDL